MVVLVDPAASSPGCAWRPGIADHVCADTSCHEMAPAVASALSARDDAKIGAPGADFIAVLPGHHPRDLGDVIEVVSDPGGQQLPQRHGSERRVQTGPIERRLIDRQGRQLPDVGLAQVGELFEQRGDRSSCRLTELGEPVERFERDRVALLEDAGAPAASSRSARRAAGGRRSRWGSRCRPLRGRRASRRGGREARRRGQRACEREGRSLRRWSGACACDPQPILRRLQPLVAPKIRSREQLQRRTRKPTRRRLENGFAIGTG